MTGDCACALNIQGKPKWMPTVIDTQICPLTFTVRLSDGWIISERDDLTRTRQLVESSNIGSSASTAATASVNIPRLGKRCHTSDICDNERFSTCMCSVIGSSKPYASTRDGSAKNCRKSHATIYQSCQGANQVKFVN